jgi:hypothetical protein
VRPPTEGPRHDCPLTPDQPTAPNRIGPNGT